MKKFNYLLKTSVLLCLTVLMLAGCGKKLTVENLTGTWVYVNDELGLDTTYTFNSDGTMTMSTASIVLSEGTYTIDGNTINYTVKGTRFDTVDSGSWTAELDDNSLTLTSSTNVTRTFYKM